MPYAIDVDERGTKFFVPGIEVDPLPNNGRLNINDLQEGDVLVWYADTTESNKTTFLIREFTEGPYTHTGIYIGDGLSVDAGTSGITQLKVSDLLREFEVCNVLRWPGISHGNVLKVVNHAKSCIGFKYAHIDARLLPLRRLAVKARYFRELRSIPAKLGKLAIAWRKYFPPKDAVYCSQLVVEAYEKAKFFTPLDVVEAARAPNDLLLENEFEYVGFISNESKPKFHILDVNAPVTRDKIAQWTAKPWLYRFKLLLWGR